MKKSSKFSPEVRERAVRMVHEARGEYPSLWAAVESIAPKIGCVAQTLLEWVKQSEVDAGTRVGRTTAETQRVNELVRRVRRRRLCPAHRPHRAALLLWYCGTQPILGANQTHAGNRNAATSTASDLA